MSKHRWRAVPIDLTGAFLDVCTECDVERHTVMDQDEVRIYFVDRDDTEVSTEPPCDPLPEEDDA